MSSQAPRTPVSTRDSGSSGYDDPRLVYPGAQRLAWGTPSDPTTHNSPTDISSLRSSLSQYSYTENFDESSYDRLGTPRTPADPNPHARISGLMDGTPFVLDPDGRIELLNSASPRSSTSSSTRTARTGEQDDAPLGAASRLPLDPRSVRFTTLGKTDPLMRCNWDGCNAVILPHQRQRHMWEAHSIHV